ncbi:hypothetical protein HBI42_168510 [Parastagonospora nodorum]|nr:hypothetical protein HBI43_160600 [Parastagonospora nodorum]KAH6249480.1 hypothetical protein HBI42_168510 [Parastagonospora nodorum]
MTSDQDFMFGGEAQVPDHCMIDDGNWNSLMDYDSFMTLDDPALDHFLASLDEDQMPSRILQAGADRVERPQAEQDRAEKIRADKERAEPQVGPIHKFSAQKPSAQKPSAQKPSAQKPSAQKLPALKGPSHPGSRYDACIEEAFSNENLKQNLLRQSYIQPPSIDYPDDRLHYLVQTLALTQRFSRLHLRWWKMPVKNWIPELQLLLKAVNDPASGLTLWTPLDEVLTLIEKTLKDENLLTTKARQLNRSSMRWTIAAVMKKIVERKTDEVEEELPALLEKKGMNARLATKYVVDTVLQDCEDRGSLMLGSVPGFSDAFRRQSVSSNWSWTD